ncbi:FMN-dependent NADH-azoreductase [Embleya sp. NPDC059237]|uniref:FMN-dependent NADH-azoreductase n=1 Tax=Embleya sp. NPDC059237 TaxID=3346784 RepID=UPI00369AB39C
MKFFRLDAAIRVEGSISRSLADLAEAEWARAFPDAEFVRRDLGRHPLPPVWPIAEASRTTPEHARTREQRAATALGTELADEFLSADAFLLAVPMYNFGVPQQVKTWIDLIITDHRAADVSRPIVPGRPALLVQARGGGYAPGTPRAGWDHATPYLHRILGDVWGLDVAAATAELTAADVNPALADLRPLAHQCLVDARADTIRHARAIADRLHAAPTSPAPEPITA